MDLEVLLVLPQLSLFLARGKKFTASSNGGGAHKICTSGLKHSNAPLTQGDLYAHLECRRTKHIGLRKNTPVLAGSHAPYPIIVLVQHCQIFISIKSTKHGLLELMVHILLEEEDHHDNDVVPSTFGPGNLCSRLQG